MNAERPVTFEKEIPLSQSRLWNQQREYYHQQGLAWDNQTNAYAVSNPFIANTYANLIIAFIRDWLAQQPEADEHPFYILELAAGSGRFGYYTIKRLQELLDDHDMQNIRIRYIMSDSSRENLEFWLFHPALEPFAHEGILDFALYDCSKDSEIHLSNAGVSLSADRLKNPLITIANRVFERVPHDCFRVSEGELYEAVPTIVTDAENIDETAIKDFTKIKINCYYRAINVDDYYPEPELNQALALCRQELNNTVFTFPICPLRALQKLNTLSNERLFVLSSDQAYTTLDELHHSKLPGTLSQEAFAVTVNMNAMAHYFTLNHGDYFFQTLQKGMKTSLLFKGMDLHHLPATSMAARQYLEDFSPTDYFTLQQRFDERCQHFSIDELVAFFNLSRWDPQIFKLTRSYICENLQDSDYLIMRRLSNNIERVANNFYHLPGAHDTLFDVAVFFHSNRMWERAIQYYQKSQHFYGELYGSTYNMALCYFEQGQLRESMCYFRKAVELKPTSKEAREWLEYVEKMRAEVVA